MVVKEREIRSRQAVVGPAKFPSFPASDRASFFFFFDYLCLCPPPPSLYLSLLLHSIKLNTQAEGEWLNCWVLGSLFRKHAKQLKSVCVKEQVTYISIPFNSIHFNSNHLSWVILPFAGNGIFPLTLSHRLLLPFPAFSGYPYSLLPTLLLLLCLVYHIFSHSLILLVFWWERRRVYVFGNAFCMDHALFFFFFSLLFFFGISIWRLIIIIIIMGGIFCRE